MKRSTTRMTIAAIAALVTTVSLTAMAWPGGKRGGPEMDPEQMVERLDRHLDLTDEQEVQIEGLFSASVSDAKADEERMTSLRTTLEGQIVSFDAGAAQKAADEIGEITGRMVYRRVNTQAGVYQVLDTEQREQFTEFQEKRKERRDSSRGRFH